MDHSAVPHDEGNESGPVYHLRQYGDVTQKEFDYYLEHRTLDGFVESAVDL